MCMTCDFVFFSVCLSSWHIEYCWPINFNALIVDAIHGSYSNLLFLDNKIRKNVTERRQSAVCTHDTFILSHTFLFITVLYTYVLLIIVGWLKDASVMLRAHSFIAFIVSFAVIIILLFLHTPFYGELIYIRTHIQTRVHGLLFWRVFAYRCFVFKMVVQSCECFYAHV